MKRVKRADCLQLLTLSDPAGLAGMTARPGPGENPAADE
jgi:hypothetical protein